MRTLKWGGTIDIGDPVLIVHDKYITLGICAGWGKNTVQYYCAKYVIQQHEYMKKYQGGQIRKAFVSLNRGDRAIKWPVDEIPANEKEDFEKALDILKLRK